jgi:hypothetical protein
VELREVIEPLLAEIESLNERIKEYEVRMEKIARESYPQVELLKQVKALRLARHCKHPLFVSRFIYPERSLAPLTMRTSAGKLISRPVEYSRRESSASLVTSVI